MLVHFDNIIYQLQNHGGISVYWQEITSRLIKNKQFDYIITKGNKYLRYAPVISNADVFHSSYFRIPMSSGGKQVVTIHDFVYELGFLKTPGKNINILQKKIAIKSADAIICISENTKKDLLRLYPEIHYQARIEVIHHGVSVRRDNLNYISASQRLLDLDKDNFLSKYILFIGGRKQYKNFNSAAIAFAKSKLPQLGYKLICTGLPFSEEEIKLLSNLYIQNISVVLDRANYEELKYLYSNAFALVYPSLYEGFGLPVLEAMSCGCPVIASNNSSIPEVVGDAGILINPNSLEEIQLALEKLLEPQTRELYIQKGMSRTQIFNWDEAARKHLELYKSLVKN